MRTHPSNRTNALLALCLTVVFSASTSREASAVEIDPETNKAVQAAGAVAGMIPEVGPLLSLATTLLFTDKSGPSYAEMKATWEGYTNTRIATAKLKELSRMVDGYQGFVKEIDNIVKDERTHQDEEVAIKEAAERNGQKYQVKTVDYSSRQIEKWQHLESAIALDLPQFVAGKTEPAAPLLPLLAAVANLRIDALDQLIVLQTLVSPEKVRETQTIRDRTMKEYNAIIEAHIVKAANERGSQIVVGGRESFQDVRTNGKGLSGDMAADTTIRVRIFSEWYVTDNGKLASAKSSDKGDAQARQARLASNAINAALHDGRLMYLIQDTMVIKVDLLRASVTEELFKDLFERFGPVKRSGLVYGNSKNPTWLMMGGIGALTPHRKQQGWGVHQGYGYVEMPAAYAKVALAFWTGDRGAFYAQGKARFTPKLSDSPKLFVGEDKRFDPWSWSWR